MTNKVRLKQAAQAVNNMAREEFSTEISLKNINDIVEDLQWGTVEISVVKGEIENIKITRNYKALSTVDKDNE